MLCRLHSIQHTNKKNLRYTIVTETQNGYSNLYNIKKNISTLIKVFSRLNLYGSSRLQMINVDGYYVTYKPIYTYICHLCSLK